jgi:uncharacterized protein (UPF0332 family)
MEKINWCFKLKKGLKQIDPNKNVSDSYLIEAEKTLSKVKQHIEEEDYLWASVRIYYSAYYSLYSFLQRIGIKSENHDCSIDLAKKILEEEFIKGIDEFKKERIDSQYYLKIGKKEVLLSNYEKAKIFYLSFKEIINSLTEQKILYYQKIIKDLQKEDNNIDE